MRSKSCGDVEREEEAFRPLSPSMKVDDLRKPVRRRSKKYQKKDNEAGESEAKIEESKVKARKTLKADGDEIENAVAEIELEERLAKARRKHKKPENRWQSRPWPHPQ